MAGQSEEVMFIMRMRDEATRILKQNGQEWENTGKKAGEAKRSISDAAAAMRTAVAAVVAIGAATKGLQLTLGVFAEYEKGMLGVKKTTGLSTKEMQQFEAGFDRMAQRIGASIGTMQSIAETAGALGVTGTSNILKFTDVVTKMGLATNLAGEEAASSLARMMNVFGESLSGVDRLASAIVELGNAGASTEREIADAATQIALQTSVFKIGSTAAVGLGAAIADMGIRSEVGASSIGRVFQTISQAATQGGAQLGVILQLTGMTADEFKKLQADSPLEAFEKFTQGLGRFIAQGGNYFSVLEALNLNQIEINKTLIPLAVNYDRMTGSITLANKAAQENAALNREVATANEGLGSITTQTFNAMTVLLKNIGSDAAPLAKAGMSGLRDTIVSVTDAYNNLPGVVRTSGAAFAAMGGSLVAAGFAVAAIRTAIGLLIPVAATLATTVRATAASTTAFGGAILGSANAARGAIGVWTALGATALMMYEQLHAGGEKASSIIAENEAALMQFKEALASVGTEGGYTVDQLNNLADAHERHLEVVLRTVQAARDAAKADFDTLTLKEFFTIGGQREDYQNYVNAEKAVMAVTKAIKEYRAEREAAQYDAYEASKNAARLDPAAGLKEAPAVGAGAAFIPTGDAIKELVAKFAPAIARTHELEEAQKQLKAMLQMSDEALQQSGLTHEQVNAILARSEELYKEQNDVIEQAATKAREQIAVLQADRQQRTALTQIQQLENAVKKDGIDLADASARKRLEDTKALIMQQEALAKQVSFTEGLRDEIADLNIQTQVATLAADDQARATAYLTKALEAERQGVTDVTGLLREYMAAWDMANAAKKQSDFREARLGELQDLQQEIELIGYVGTARQRQAQLISIAMEAQKAGIQDIQPLLQQYLDLWEQIDQSQRGAVGAISGVNAALSKFIEDSQNMAAGFEDLTTNMLDGFVNSITDAVFEGKMTFDKFFSDIGKMMFKMALKSWIANLLDTSGLGSKGLSIFGAIGSATKLNAMSPHMMNVAAGVVNVNGPLGAGGSFGLGTGLTGPSSAIKSIFSKIPGLSTLIPALSGIPGIGAAASVGSALTRIPGIGAAGSVFGNLASVGSGTANAVIKQITKAVEETVPAVIQPGKQVLPNVAYPNAAPQIGTPGSMQLPEIKYPEVPPITKVLEPWKKLFPDITKAIPTPRPDFGGSMKNILKLSGQDVIDLKKTLMTEWVQSAGPDQGKGIIDTILNRRMSGHWGDSIADVVNARKQFSDINGPVAWRAGRHSVNDLSDSLLNSGKGLRASQFTDQYLAQRMAGADSIVGNNLNYANPYYSDAKNRAWIDRLEGPRLGSGRNIHQHGTTPDLEQYRPNPYQVAMDQSQTPSLQSAYPMGTGLDSGAGAQMSALTEQMRQISDTTGTLTQNMQMLNEAQTTVSSVTQGLGPQMQMAGSAMQQTSNATQMMVPQMRMMGTGLQTAAPPAMTFSTGLMTMTGPLAQAPTMVTGFTDSVTQMIQQLAASKMISGLGAFPFAAGGVMVPGRGPRRLEMFSAGGVSSKPAIFGEGPLPEAAVPLPDGRAIPVKFKSPKSAAGNSSKSQRTTTNVFSPSITINNSGPRDKADDEAMSEDLQNRLEEMFDRKFAANAQDQMRSGGMIGRLR